MRATRLDDDALRARVGDTNLFCRVSPAQKGRIIMALKRAGHTIGYLGDGVNDAPSLHAADVGLSVDTAVDVVREAAEMIPYDTTCGSCTMVCSRGGAPSPTS